MPISKHRSKKTRRKFQILRNNVSKANKKEMTEKFFPTRAITPWWLKPNLKKIPTSKK